MATTKHQDYLESISRNLKNYRSNATFCDVILSVGDVQYPAHKLILGASSPFFATMFNGHFVDSYEKEVVLSSFEPKSFEAIIDYMYSGELKIDETSVLQIFKAADFLQMAWPKQQCHEYFKQMITTSTCLSIWKTAILYDLPDIREEAEKHIVSDLETVSESSEFLALPFEDVYTLLGQNDISALFNESIFLAIKYWIEWDRSERMQHLESLLKLIRINSISQSFLDRVIRNEEFLRESSAGTNWLLDSFTLTQTYQAAANVSYGDVGSADSQIYIAETYEDNFYGYNVQTMVVNRLAMRPPSQGFSMITYNGGVYIIGGKRTRTALKYGPLDNFWETVSLRCYGFASGTCVLNDSVYFTGGYMEHRLRSSVKSYDFQRGKLERQPRMLITRAFHGAVAHRSCIYACGGTSLSGPNEFVSVALAERIDVREGMWRLLPNMQHEHGQCTSAIVLDAIYCSSLHGGLTERFDIRRYNWESIAVAPGQAGSIVAYEDTLYQVHSAGIARYYNESNTWSNVLNYSFEFPIATSFSN